LPKHCFNPTLVGFFASLWYIGNMKNKGIKQFVSLVFCFLAVLILSGCSLSNPATNTAPASSNIPKTDGSFLKSVDGGTTWVNKVAIDAKSNISSTNVLSMAIDPKNSNIIYLGTEKDGLFVSKDGAEKWEKLVFPLTKIYGLAIDNNNGTIYASGIYNSRAKIYKSIDGGVKWEETYTEPANDSTISALKISQKNPNVLYCGTSEGMIIKTTDGGKTWKNLMKAAGPVSSIAFDSNNGKAVYFGVFGKSVLRTLDGGGKIDDLGNINLSQFIKERTSSFNTYSVEADPQISGVFYVGTDSGMLKGSDFGNRWEEINILESSKKFPIRTIAINPKNSNEIIYGNSGVIYQSKDNGNTWFTFQLNTTNTTQIIKYDPSNPGNIYTGLRKI
jgi:photosystem II stability/assembly factor-like uncharacterized protein